MRKLWEGRLGPETDELVEAYTSSLDIDRRLWAEDVEGSLAHAAMLHEVGLLNAGEHATLERALDVVRDELERGDMAFAPSDEDIHSAIERRLHEVAGEVAGRLHAGRSRNDQVATDLRLYCRRACDRLTIAACELQDALVGRAEQHRETIMPGYTHGQRAQVVSLAHHLLAYVEMLHRDVERLEQARRRCDVLPLGSGALAGTTLPIDRESVALRLHFERISGNSMDAVGDRDFAVDIVCACALLMVHLSRLGEEIVLWCSGEAGFAELPDELATGSSLMPNKKNPDVLELARGRAGRTIAALVTLLTVLKGLPLAYNRDLQEDKEALFGALDTAQASTTAVAAVVAGLRFDTNAMRRAASDPSLAATDVAEHLVMSGVPFREAHGIVGAAVRRVREGGRTLADLTPQEWRELGAPGGEDVPALFDVDSLLSRRELTGGPGPESVGRQIELARRLVAASRRGAEQRLGGRPAPS